VTKYATVEDLKSMHDSHKEHALYFIISSSNQAYVDEVVKLAENAKNTFLLTLDRVQMMSDELVAALDERIGKADVVLWKKKVS
jgi:hypothetical protein